MCSKNVGQKSTNCEDGTCPDVTEEWEILEILAFEDNANAYGIIILNRPVTHNREYLCSLWKNAKITVTVDGGTDRWDSFLQQLDEDTRSSLRPPHLITGDFDSIGIDTLTKYMENGSKIIRTPDQDATDFTKALMELNSHCIESDVWLDTIVVISETSGRLDQIMANINTLFLIAQRELLRNSNTRVYLMSNDSVSWLLRRGEHVIHIPELLRETNSWCALVPVGEECTSVTTTGLKWNLVNHPMKFGTLVSTSNTYDGSPTVKIKCSHTLLWSMKISALLPREM